MRITAFSTLALGFGVVALQLGACSNSAEDCEATASCSGASGGTAGAGGKSNSGGASGSGAEAGADGSGSSSGGNAGMSGTANGGVGANGEAGSGGGGPVACTGEVADDPTCWTTDEYGVFVSSDAGDDATGDGTQASPFATITRGIELATDAGKSVYVCRGEEIYAEQVIVADGPTDGVHIYGGFECEGWTHSKTRMVLVEAPTNIALRLKDLKKGVLIENVSFLAAPGSGTQSSSISSYGAFITNSKNVLLRRVDVTAGAGADGESGVDQEPGADGTLAGAAQDGQPTACGVNTVEGAPGKWAAATACFSKGGTGGVGFVDSNGGPGADGIPKTNVTPPNKVNLGLGSSSGDPGADGEIGASGNPGMLGAAAASLGLFLGGGYIPAPGNDGLVGFPGQGGGGGGASLGHDGCRGASGGAGGMGGCGGAGGTGGKGGGASVGLFSWSSNVTLESCTIASSTGGKGGQGGKGGDGGLGMPGGLAGNGKTGSPSIAKAGRGGDGGPGGNGGSGSGGTGGPSYPIVHQGVVPVYDPLDTTLTPSTGGAAGPGGAVGAEIAEDGAEGDSAEIYAVP